MLRRRPWPWNLRRHILVLYDRYEIAWMQIERRAAAANIPAAVARQLGGFARVDRRAIYVRPITALGQIPLHYAKSTTSCCVTSTVSPELRALRRQSDGRATVPGTGSSPG